MNEEQLEACQRKLFGERQQLYADLFIDNSIINSYIATCARDIQYLSEG